MRIDLNSDLGESFGRYTLGHDETLMPLITSANIACGFHAGDPVVMQQTVRLAIEHQVGLGAHPAYPDLQGFGRREMNLAPDEVEAMILYQISALAGIVKSEGGTLGHVKPHGALYNQAGRDRALAQAIARGVKRFSKELVLVGLAASPLIEAGLESGLRVAREGFPERGYNADGTLLNRKLQGAVITSPHEAAANALKLIRERQLETLCIHGDNEQAVEIAHAIRQALETNKIEVRGL